jgi:hypothetical protein
MSKRSLLFVALVLFVAALAVAPAQPARAEGQAGTIIVELNTICSNGSMPNLMPNNYFQATVKTGNNQGGGQMNYMGSAGNYRSYKFQGGFFVPGSYYARWTRTMGAWNGMGSVWVGPYVLNDGGLAYWTFWLSASTELGCP